MTVIANAPIGTVATYAYVNPVIAVILGAALLDEPITIWNVSGAALVLLAVAGAFRDRQLHRVPRRTEAG